MMVKLGGFGSPEEMLKQLQTVFGKEVGKFSDTSQGFNSFFRNQNIFLLNVKDNGSAFMVEAELPGFEKGQIDISLKNRELVITATREEEKLEEGTKLVQEERITGEFKRTVSFVDENITEEIVAKYENGILTITVPKDEKEINEKKIVID